MKKAYVIKMVMVALVLLVLSSQVVFADAVVKFEATRVDFLPDGDLLVQGSFLNAGNQSGAVDSVQMEIYLMDSNNNKSLLTKSAFSSVGAVVPAGGLTNWQFRITNVPLTPIYRWSVDTQVRYHW